MSTPTKIDLKAYFPGKRLLFFALTVSKIVVLKSEGGVRVCGDAVLRYFWCGFAVIFILTRGIAVSKH